VLTPDEFLVDLLDLDPPLVLATLAEQVNAYRLKPHTIDDLLRALEASGVPRFCEEVRRRQAG
jgi:hypothetical protein